jgi:hypothetical protein
VAAPFKRLIFDIETSPTLFAGWQTGKTHLTHHQIVRDPSIICVSWMWEGGKNVHSLTWDKRQNPKKMLARFVPIMHSADEVVGHNGDRFDIKWIRGECIRYGIPMAPDFVSIDTLKLTRALCRYPSNRLDYLGKTHGLGGKDETGGLDLWIRILMNNDQAALHKMVSYNKRDVRLLAAYWAKIKPYVKAKSHRGRDMSACPECGGERLENRGSWITPAGHHKTKLRCRGCGKHQTVTTSSYLKRKALRPPPPRGPQPNVAESCPKCGMKSMENRGPAYTSKKGDRIKIRCRYCGKTQIVLRATFAKWKKAYVKLAR